MVKGLFEMRVLDVRGFKDPDYGYKLAGVKHSRRGTGVRIGFVVWVLFHHG
jgi:hypothetical protein